jgi:predicted transposase YdaD
MIDNICKFLAESFPNDFASWILGKSIPLTKLEPSELSVDPICADSIIFVESKAFLKKIDVAQSAASIKIFNECRNQTN